MPAGNRPFRRIGTLLASSIHWFSSGALRSAANGLVQLQLAVLDLVKHSHGQGKLEGRLHRRMTVFVYVAVKLYPPGSEQPTYTFPFASFAMSAIC